jgi:hypothetical protein
VKVSGRMLTDIEWGAALEAACLWGDLRQVYEGLRAGPPPPWADAFLVFPFELTHLETGEPDLTRKRAGLQQLSDSDRRLLNAYHQYYLREDEPAIEWRKRCLEGLTAEQQKKVIRMIDKGPGDLGRRRREAPTEFSWPEVLKGLGLL